MENREKVSKIRLKIETINIKISYICIKSLLPFLASVELLELQTVTAIKIRRTIKETLMVTDRMTRLN